MSLVYSEHGRNRILSAAEHLQEKLPKQRAALSISKRSILMNSYSKQASVTVTTPAQHIINGSTLYKHVPDVSSGLESGRIQQSHNHPNVILKSN